MKKRMLLFTLLAGMGYLSLSSYSSGPAYFGLNRTGSQNSATTCGGGGCHGGISTATSVSIAVDSSSVAISKYVPGHTYSVTITGHNTSSLPKFGYQFSVVSGIGASQVQAGSCAAPSGSHNATLGTISILEHSSPLSGSAGTYTVSFNWTAPAAGTGNVIMYCNLNAVDGLGGPDAADKNNVTSLTLGETTAVPELSQDIAITAYPNPATSQFTLKMGNATGDYTINIYDMSGRVVASQIIHASSNTTNVPVNCANWPKGYYGVQISQNGAQRVLPLVKL